jgi:hypothetical protein
VAHTHWTKSRAGLPVARPGTSFRAHPLIPYGETQVGRARWMVSHDHLMGPVAPDLAGHVADAVGESYGVAVRDDDGWEARGCVGCGLAAVVRAGPGAWRPMRFQASTCAEYEQAVRMGRTVIAVKVDGGEARDRADAILEGRGAHTVNHFGTGVVRTLKA